MHSGPSLVVVHRMDCMSRPLYMRVEPGVIISGVVYDTGGAIRFNQLVVAFNFIAVTFLSLFLDVVSVVILHSILELVFGVSLSRIIIIISICLYNIIEIRLKFLSKVKHHRWHGRR